MGVFQDLLKGDFSAVVHDIVAGFNRLPAPVQAFIGKLESDDGKLLSSLAESGIKDVLAGGFTTASFVSAGKDIVSQALAQGKTILISDALAALNIQASAVQSTPQVAVASPAVAADTLAPSVASETN